MSCLAAQTTRAEPRNRAEMSPRFVRQIETTACSAEVVVGITQYDRRARTVAPETRSVMDRHRVSRRCRVQAESRLFARYDGRVRQLPRRTAELFATASSVAFCDSSAEPQTQKTPDQCGHWSRVMRWFQKMEPSMNGGGEPSFPETLVLQYSPERWRA